VEGARETRGQEDSNVMRVGEGGLLIQCRTGTSLLSSCRVRLRHGLPGQSVRHGPSGIYRSRLAVVGRASDSKGPTSMPVLSDSEQC
jgi:hypothetical protein